MIIRRIALVIVGNIITQNNTNKSVEAINDELKIFREEILKQTISKAEIEEHIEKINNTWEEKFEKLAYYIEHDELEKASSELTKLKADVETENYDFAIENLDNCVFILEHIKDKSALKIVNIF